jgi:hypothetical protein
LAGKKKNGGMFAVEQLGRVGLASRGFMYLVAAGLCLRLSFGDRERVDRDGALDALARQRVGSLLLVLMAIGFAGYAAWRLTRAVTGASEGRDDDSKSEIGRRAADVGRGLLYLAGCWQALRVLFGGRDEGGGNQETDLTVTLMQQSWGRIAVGLLGLLLLGSGGVLAYRGLKEKFAECLDMRRVPKRWRGPIPVVGQIGFVARGLVIALVGFFFLQAAIQFDAQEAVGVSGALGRLAKQPWGPVVLVAIAAGLLCFAVLSFVEARYRKVLED